ncbi:MAG: hypothetical protein OXR68_02785 [Alphaproteobacteria bacterium]|nr:hypothetical protein [Alphaproteobacteria bacterium]MDD9919529.1 hypothetical protein [Alphaproteobacteria bacterium]
MKYQSSIRAERGRHRNLQVSGKRRNKAGKFLGRLVVKMRNRRLNGKAGRYAVTQG